MDPLSARSERAERLSRLASRQGGVVSIGQLHALGVSDEQVKVRLRRGQLHRVHRGVYLVGLPQLSARGRLNAALLAAGPDAFLSHRTGAAERGLCPLSPRSVEVTVPGRSRTSTRPGLIIHRTTDEIVRDEVTRRSGLLVATVPRLLIELAARETPLQLEALITMAVRKQVFDPHEVEAAIARHAGRPGIGALKTATARYRPGPDRKSGLERSVARWLSMHPEIPEPEGNVVVGGWEIDFLWRSQGVALELDGRPYHVAVQDFDKDGYKDTQLQLMGFRPMRVSDFRWEHDRARVIRDLRAMLGPGGSAGT